MIPALIVVAALAALVEFFISYCRSLVSVYSKVELSPQARDLAGLKGPTPRGDAFPRLVQLVECCPKPADDRIEVRALRAYYALLNLLRATGFLAPMLAQWAENERVGCAHFAAVALDRRLGCSFDGIT